MSNDMQDLKKQLKKIFTIHVTTGGDIEPDRKQLKKAEEAIRRYVKYQESKIL